jgi:phosphoacetylglucosamine mutase
MICSIVFDYHQGGMLEQSWESYATSLANAEDGDIGSVLWGVMQSEGISLASLSSARVFTGRDTRSSSEYLNGLTVEGVKCLGGSVVDYGLLTTPQLHHIVKMTNEGGAKLKWASEEGYYEMLSEAYLGLLSGVDGASSRSPLTVDCAFGVGALKVPLVSSKVSALLTIRTINGVGEGELNYKVGAEHVQKSRTAPVNIKADEIVGHRMASVDGDADRLVYWYHSSKDRSFHLLDGDAIAALAGKFIYEQLDILGLKEKVKVGVVQTAYANGASTNYLKKCGVPLAMAKTGVKYVHHAALEFDVGIYFEANGHGTVLFQDSVIKVLEDLKSRASTLSPQETIALHRLLYSHQLINQAVGDAISDLLLVEAILSIYKWDLPDWSDMYTDLPSRQGKIKVKDRTAVVTIPDETRTTAPEGLQEAIDELVGTYTNGRAFVRPSGTEDAVRIYAEANTQEAADELALLVSRALYKFGGGVGECP